MSKRHIVTLHHIMTVYIDMFDHMDGVMRAFAEKMTASKEDLFFNVMLARQMQSKWKADVPPLMGMRLVCAYILDCFWKL